MIIPVYDSSEEEIGSSTRFPVPSTMKPSISSSSGMPYIVPEISVKLTDVGFLKGFNVDFWLMLGCLVYLGLSTHLSCHFFSHFFLFNLFFLLASCLLFLHKAFPNSSFNIELWSR